MKKNNPIDVWNKINIKGENECWEWVSGLTEAGYGRMRINHIKYMSHRIVWELTFGSIPNNLCVLHHCDNRKCCNPKHLFLGTHIDNVIDKVNKNRQQKLSGELNGRHKLIFKEVLEIRNLYLTGEYFQKDIAKIFGITQATVSSIILFKTWNKT